MIRCPECGKPEIHRQYSEETVTVIFECLFSANLPIGLTDTQMQERLDLWRMKGGMDEWLGEGL